MPIDIVDIKISNDYTTYGPALELTVVIPVSSVDAAAIRAAMAPAYDATTKQTTAPTFTNLQTAINTAVANVPPTSAKTIVTTILGQYQTGG